MSYTDIFFYLKVSYVKCRTVSPHLIIRFDRLIKGKQPYGAVKLKVLWPDGKILFDSGALCFNCY